MYDSYNGGSENLVLHQLVIPKLIFLFILITCLVDIVLVVEGEIQSWSLMGVKGLTDPDAEEDVGSQYLDLTL